MNNQREGRAAHKEPWFWIIISPLIVVVIACAITISIALNTKDDVVIGDYYKEGLLINQKTDQLEEAIAMGIHGSLIVDNLSGTIRAELSAAKLENLADMNSLVLELRHPAFAERDKSLLLHQTVLNTERAVYVGAMEDISVGERWYWRLHPENESPDRWLMEGEADFSSQSSVPLTLK